MIRRQTGARVKAIRIKSGGGAVERASEVAVTRGELVDALALAGWEARKGWGPYVRGAKTMDAVRELRVREGPVAWWL